MTDQHTHPAAAAAPAPPPPPRRRRWPRVLAWLVVAPLVLVVGLAGAGLLAAHTERGSRWLWQAAVVVLDGKLAGQWEGGTLADGAHLREVAYTDGATHVTLDRLDGRWALQSAPWRLRIAFLQLGTLDLKLAPQAPAQAPAALPQRLTLPLALRVDAVSVHRLILHAPALELTDIALHGETDGRHHTLVLDNLTTPYGRVNASMRLDGARPFALSGDAAVAGRYDTHSYHLSLHLSGSLEALRADLSASGDRLAGHANVSAAPFDAVPLKRAQVAIDHLDPRLFSATAPSADLSLRADLAPVDGASTLQVAGPISVSNAESGSLDRQRLPLVSAAARVMLDATHQVLTDVQVRLPGGATLTGGGKIEHQAQTGRTTGQFELAARKLDLRALQGKLPATRLAGPLKVTLDGGSQQVALDWRDPTRRIQLDAVLDGGAVTLRSARLSAGAGRIDLRGSLRTDAGGSYEANAVMTQFDPAAWFDTGVVSSIRAGQPATRISGQLQARGTLHPTLDVEAKFALRDSQYAGLPMGGEGTVRLAGGRLLPSSAQLLVAGNRARLDGSFGAAGDRLRVDVDAPHLNRLGFGLAGLLQVHGQLSGTLVRPALQADFRAEQLAFGNQRLAHLSGRANIEGGLHAPGTSRLELTLAGRDYRASQVALSRVDINLAGTRASHRIRAEFAGTLRGQPLALALAAQGGVTDQQGRLGWDGTIQKLSNDGLPRFALTRPWRVKAAAQTVQLGAAHFTLAGASVDLGQFDYRQGELRTSGSINALDIGNVLTLVKEFTGTAPPLQSNLVLDGSWNLVLAKQADGFVQLARRSGDLMLTDGRRQTLGVAPGLRALGISALRVRADLRADQINLTAHAAAGSIGQLDAKVSTAVQMRDGRPSLPEHAPLAGSAAFDVPNLNAVGALAGPQLLLKGRAAARLTLGGTVGKPLLSGNVTGDDLSITMFDLGIQLTDGTVRLAMDRNAIELNQVEFHGGAGTLKATGRIGLEQADPAMNATIVADKLQLFAAPDRQLILSGQAKASGNAEHLAIAGKFVVDRARFDLPPSGTPSLGDDVVIVRDNGQTQAAKANAAARAARISEKPANRFAPHVDVDLDLGRDFRFKGAGADLLLRGSMHVRSEPLAPLRASGTIQIAEGTYEAFGRRLSIERGHINFTGPLDNPGLFIIAMRTNQAVEAGVQVTGTVRQPRVTLVSDPNVPDEAKLSWLMFGHGPESAGLGQQQAVAGAALAMLGTAGGKRIVQNFGIDQFSIGSSDSGLPDQQVVNIGKAISESLSIGFEQSLTSAASIAKLTWQLSRRWSLVARTGSIYGLDILFNRRFD
ncbi:MAG: translocation/assembly module TamB [Burkholderiales bacterium]|nr:translocation/assembly module TamB [Burkholderiales bacterium]